MSSNIQKFQLTTNLWRPFLIFVLAMFVYTLLVLLPIPAAVGLFVRYNLVLLIIITLPLLFITFRIKGFLGTLAALSLTLILFGLPLSGLWRSGASEPFIIGGLLPFSDAASYYSDALRVVEGFRFSAFSARRPLFPALLTGLLAITGQNLVVSIAILGAIIAISCYLAAREIQHSFGALPAVVFLFILFLFYRRIAGTTMTENLGLPLGVASFTILWNAARQKKIWHTAIGLLLLTLALNARAGTFFILPALILWCGFAFKGNHKFSFIAAGIGTLAVALGFGLNMLVFKLVADPGGMVFSNFSYTLYGVVAGGKGWMQILIDHPELAQFDDVSRSARTYALVFDAWKSQPFNIVVGAAKNWFDYLMPRGAGAFGFIRGNEAINWANYAVRIVLSIFAGWGFFRTWKQRRQEPYSMLLWAAAGIILSVPFVPPNDSNQMRVYAATVTFLMAFSTIGLKSILGFIITNQITDSKAEASRPSIIMSFGILLAIVTIGGVLVVKAVAKPQPLPLAECPVGETQIITRLTPGSLVNINGLPISKQVNVPLESFSELNEGYPEMHEVLIQAVGGGAILARPLDLISMEYPLLVIPKGLYPDEQGFSVLCVLPIEDEELSRRGWMKVISSMYLR
ncbi:MAG: hypothetical protein CVU42_11845 [Chloroflexi bacterium HGW-Chloroflexi-4]|jgi:hypothetical protein|nr:MAG: hypothetical protein CVU42_11845 [Chloroflexi bacterium HGW-Chloroflexi-4]